MFPVNWREQSNHLAFGITRLLDVTSWPPLILPLLVYILLNLPYYVLFYCLLKCHCLAEWSRYQHSNIPLCITWWPSIPTILVLHDTAVTVTVTLLLDWYIYSLFCFLHLKLSNYHFVKILIRTVWLLVGALVLMTLSWYSHWSFLLILISYIIITS